MAKTRIFNLELKQDFFTANQLTYSDSENYWSLYDAHFKKNLLIKILTEYPVNNIHSAIAIEQLCILLCEQQITKTVIKKNKHWSSELREYLYENWTKTYTLSELSQ